MFRTRGFIFRKTVVYTVMVWYGIVWYGMVWYDVVWYVFHASEIRSIPYLCIQPSSWR